MATETCPNPDNDIAPTFDDMKLNEHLLRGIYGYGFEKPSAVQQRAIKVLAALGLCSAFGRVGSIISAPLARAMPLASS